MPFGDEHDQAEIGLDQFFSGIMDDRHLVAELRAGTPVFSDTHAQKLLPMTAVARFTDLAVHPKRAEISDLSVWRPRAALEVLQQDILAKLRHFLGDPLVEAVFPKAALQFLTKLLVRGQGPGAFRF